MKTKKLRLMKQNQKRKKKNDKKSFIKVYFKSFTFLITILLNQSRKLLIIGRKEKVYKTCRQGGKKKGKKDNHSKSKQRTQNSNRLNYIKREPR